MKKLLILVVLVMCLMASRQVLSEQSKNQSSAKAENEQKYEFLSAANYAELTAIFQNLNKKELIDAIKLKEDNIEMVDRDTAMLFAANAIGIDVFSKELRNISTKEREILIFLFPEFSNYDEFAWFEKRHNLQQIWTELVIKLSSKIIIMKSRNDIEISDYDFKNECFNIKLIQRQSFYIPIYHQTSLDFSTFVFTSTEGNPLGGGGPVASSRMDKDCITYYPGILQNGTNYAQHISIYGYLYVKPDMGKEIKNKLKTGWEKFFLFSYCNLNDSYGRRIKSAFRLTHIFAYNGNLKKIIFASSRNHSKGQYHLSSQDWTKINIDLEDGKIAELVSDNVASDIEFKIKKGSDFYTLKRIPANKTLSGKEAIRFYSGMIIGKDWAGPVDFSGHWHEPMILQPSKDCDVSFMIFYVCE